MDSPIRRIGCCILFVCCVAAAGCTLKDLDLWPHSARPIVKVGLVAPFEGRDRALGYEVLYAVRWAVRERNERGGVGGALVELVALNDNGDPAESVFQARELAVDPAVVGVIGPFSTAAAEAAAPLYQELGLPVLIPATCPAGIAGGSVFCLAASADRLAEALVDRLPAGAQAALLWESQDPLQSALAARIPDVRQRTSDPIAHVLQPPADIYLYTGDALPAVELLKQMRGAAVEAPLWGGPQLARSQLPQAAGEALEGTCYAITAAAQGDEAFVAGYMSLAGQAPGPWAALAYDGAELLLDAIERDVFAAGQATRAGTADQLSRSEDPESIFVAGQRTGARVVFYCFRRGDGYPGQVVSP